MTTQNFIIDDVEDFIVRSIKVNQTFYVDDVQDYLMELYGNTPYSAIENVTILEIERILDYNFSGYYDPNSTSANLDMDWIEIDFALDPVSRETVYTRIN